MNINDFIDASGPLDDFPHLPMLDDDAAGHWWEAPGYGQRVCSACVNNDVLERVVFNHAPGTRCAFCGSDASFAAPVDELSRYVYRSLFLEYDRPETNAMVPTDPDLWELLAIEAFSTENLLYDLGEPFASDDLTAMLDQAIDHDWLPIDGIADTVEERMVSSWQAFRQQTRTPASTSPPHARTRDDEAIFEKIQDYLQVLTAQLQNRVVRKQEPGLVVFRGRWHAEDSFTAPDDLGSPPADCTGPQRLSAEGIQCFYGAEDQHTAVQEIRPAVGSIVSLGRWETTQPLVVIDFANDWPVPSIFDPVASGHRRYDRFVRDFAKEISQPTKPDATLADEYRATQLLAAFFRNQLMTPFQQGVDAIRYRSSLNGGAANWCLFGTPDRAAPPVLKLVETHATVSTAQ